MRRLMKGIGMLLLVLVLAAAIGIGVLTAVEYRPAEREDVEVLPAAAASLRAGDSFTVLSWNIGYGALGDNADFFMDGGSMVRTADRARVERNLADMQRAAQAEDPDVILLQEVDLRSDRSFRVDQTASWRSAFPAMDSAFAYNFHSLYVPYPVPPIGHVESGLLTLSRFSAAAAERLRLPCPFSWPVRIVNLKRCLLVTRIPVGESELVLVNLHLEAYDSGEGKEAQTRRLAAFLQAEREQGHWVIAGGDFNQVFSTVDTSAYPAVAPWQPGEIDAAAFPEGFALLMDASVPTCRSLDRPLAGAAAEDFQFYVIDGFIVSDNVAVDSVRTLSLGFGATDHNPVLLKVTLQESTGK